MWIYHQWHFRLLRDREGQPSLDLVEALFLNWAKGDTGEEKKLV